MKLSTKLFLIANSTYTQLCKGHSYAVGIKDSDGVIYEVDCDLYAINRLIECSIERVGMELSALLEELARESRNSRRRVFTNSWTTREVTWLDVDMVNLVVNIVNSRLNGEELKVLSNEESSMSVNVDPDEFRRVLRMYMLALQSGYSPNDKILDSVSRALFDIIVVIYSYDLLNSKHGSVLREIIKSEVASLDDLSVINSHLNTSEFIKNSTNPDVITIVESLDAEHAYIGYLPFIERTYPIQVNLSLINLVQVNAI